MESVVREWLKTKVNQYHSPGPEVFIKLFSCSTQLSTKLQLLIKTKIPTNKDASCFKSLRYKYMQTNKMPTLTFMSRINLVLNWVSSGRDETWYATLHHGGHYSYQNKSDCLWSLPFSFSGIRLTISKDDASRISRWPLQQPYWSFECYDFSSSEFLCDPNDFHQVSIRSDIWPKCLRPSFYSIRHNGLEREFQDSCHNGYLRNQNGSILAFLILHVGPGYF